MNAIDIILIAVIAAAVFLAVRRIVRDKKSGKSCSCGCEGCTANCPSGKRSSKGGSHN